jgi:predicted CoA-binding protein
MECEMPTINSTTDEIKEIFANTKTIAVIGLSPDETKDSHRVAKYLKEAGFTIVPVYPKGDEILGEKVYRSLAEIPFKVDMVDIFRKPAVVMDVVKASIERGDIDTVWAQKGIVNNEACELAVANGMKAVQNLCTMVEHRNL